MATPCLVPASGAAFLSGLLNHIDCQAQTIGAGGYEALAAPGSAVSLALTAAITIVIAIFGFRMMMGYVPSIGDAVVAALKIGVALLLATSWPAYRVIVYDITLHGPAELFESIGTGSDLPGAEGGLVTRLQGVDNAIVAFIVAGTGRFDLSNQPQSQQSQAGQTDTVPLGRVSISDDFAFGFARIAYLVGTIGSLGLVRLIAGLSLALAPLFAGLLLFEGTRGYFGGWVQILFASALGALGITVILSVELSLLEPWLTNVLALREARVPTPGAPVELLVMTLAFAIMLFGTIGASARIAFAIHIPNVMPSLAARSSGRSAQLSGREARDPPPARNGAESSRALVVAEAVTSAQRRDISMMSSGTDGQNLGWANIRITNAVRPTVEGGEILRGAHSRRTARRMSPSATRRSLRS